MRITIPRLPQLARTQTSRGISLAVDTRGQQALLAQTGAAFEAAANAANVFWELELQEDENEQLTSAVTMYGAGLDEATSQAAAATPAQSRSVFESSAAETLAKVRETLTNKQARQRFELHAASKYTARATEQRKIARDRIMQGRVLRTTQSARDLAAIAGDISKSPLERKNAMIGLFGQNEEGLPVIPGLYEKAVADGTFNGKPAADAAQAARVQIATDLATGYVMRSSDPESTAMGLQQLADDRSRYMTDDEKQLRGMLSSLGQDARAEVMKELVDRATEIATDRAARRTRLNEAKNLDFQKVYNDALDPNTPIERVRQIAQDLNAWTGFTAEKRKGLDQVLARRGSGEPLFANVDIPGSVRALEDHLSNRTLNQEALTRHAPNITPTTYNKYSAAIREQNKAGFQRAVQFVDAEFRYEKYKNADTSKPLVRISQAAAQDVRGDMIKFSEKNPTASPSELMAEAQRLVDDRRAGFRSIILNTRQDYLDSIERFVGGALVTDDPLAELKERIAAGTLKLDVRVRGVIAELRDYKAQLGDN